MSFSKKRKIDNESRVFLDKWTALYLFIEVNKKPVCLVCSQQVSVVKEYNIQRHYETNHCSKYNNIQGQLRQDKIREMIKSLKKQQMTFTKIREINDSAVKTSFIIANEIAKSSKPFSDGEFIKMCMIQAAEVVCPDKKQAFNNISLTRNTVADRIADLSKNIDQQIKEKIKTFTAFSIAIDESTDINDIAQLAIFIRGVDKNLFVTEEFLELVPMFNTTTSDDIFNSLVNCLERVEVDWTKAVSLATDGAPSMLGRKAGVAAKFREKVQALNGEQGIWVFHCILHQEVLCCKSLKMNHVMELVLETVNFIRS